MTTSIKSLWCAKHRCKALYIYYLLLIIKTTIRNKYWYYIPTEQMKKLDANFTIPHYHEINFMIDMVPHHSFNLHVFNLQNWEFSCLLSCYITISFANFLPVLCPFMSWGLSIHQFIWAILYNKNTSWSYLLWLFPMHYSPFVFGNF